MTTMTQQFAIYDAEALVDPGRLFTTLDDVQVFVDDLRDTWWWPRRYDRLVRVEVGPSRSRRHAVGWYDHKMGAGRIEIPPQMRNELTIVHELAHVVAELYHNSKAHDPAFAREYANLMYLIMGSDAWQALHAGYMKYKIDYDVNVYQGSAIIMH